MGAYSIAPDVAGSPPYIRAPSRMRAHPEFCSLGVLRLRYSSPAMDELPACPCLPPHISYECLLLRGTTAVYFIGPTLSHPFYFSILFYHTLTLGLQRSTNPPTLATSGYVLEVV